MAPTNNFPILIRQLIPSAELRKSVSDFHKSQQTYKDLDWGRMSNDIPTIPQIINTKVDSLFWSSIYDCAKSHFPKDIVPSYWKWAKYSPLFSTPKLPPHIDINACTYTIDLQLLGNVEWEIYIEGKPYLMRDGDALLYMGSDQLHWRPKYPSDSIKSYLEMCFFHFVEPGHWYHTKGQKHINSDEIRLPWKKRMLELLPEYKCDTYQSLGDEENFNGW